MKILSSLAMAGVLASTGQPVAATVHVRNFAFSPATVTVRAGDRVTFVNDDDEAHTVTAVDKSFDSQGLDAGDTWSHTFDEPGTYPYFCALHPYMRGEVIVK
ncbi:MAG TPA: cupredoxin family copper-binding protein [Candidatus Acidoferrales bacterium]|nr:cupredoxin family copper-binding protein [Candidatus Acidoferrales bacterium]